MFHKTTFQTSVKTWMKMKEKLILLFRILQTTKEIHRDSFVSTDSFDKEAFLEAIRAYRCLWDTNNASYKNRTMKINAWRSLSTLFKVEGV